MIVEEVISVKAKEKLSHGTNIATVPSAANINNRQEAVSRLQYTNPSDTMNGNP